MYINLINIFIIPSYKGLTYSKYKQHHSDTYINLSISALDNSAI
jgi:hypothetical protein